MNMKLISKEKYKKFLDNLVITYHILLIHGGTI